MSEFVLFVSECESRYAEQVRALQQQMDNDHEQLLQDTSAQRTALESEIDALKDEEAKVREKLANTLEVRDNLDNVLLRDGFLAVFKQNCIIILDVGSDSFCVSCNQTLEKVESELHDVTERAVELEHQNDSLQHELQESNSLHQQVLWLSMTVLFR